MLLNEWRKARVADSDGNRGKSVYVLWIVSCDETAGRDATFRTICTRKEKKIEIFM